MATLEGKYGPTSTVKETEAVSKLEAYMRINQASLEGRGKNSSAPILSLSDGQLTALFAPRQLTTLVQRPLGRLPRSCGL